MNKTTVYILTLFPQMFDGFLANGMLRRAEEKGLADVIPVNVRDSAHDRHKTVDDTPYGGGAGMVMRADVLAESLESLPPFRENRRPPVILMTPQAKPFMQTDANELSLCDELVIVCGRYRAIDERFTEMFVTREISIGDYVLSGGEPAAMVVVDALVRLLPGVLNDFESGIEDSFQDGLLDCPWYTRPEEFRGATVPEVLTSGDHARIQKWRDSQRIERTRIRRPDLLSH